MESLSNPLEDKENNFVPGNVLSTIAVISELKENENYDTTLKVSKDQDHNGHIDKARKVETEDGSTLRVEESDQIKNYLEDKTDGDEETKPGKDQEKKNTKTKTETVTKTVVDRETEKRSINYTREFELESVTKEECDAKAGASTEIALPLPPSTLSKLDTSSKPSKSGLQRPTSYTIPPSIPTTILSIDKQITENKTITTTTTTNGKTSGGVLGEITNKNKTSVKETLGATTTATTTTSNVNFIRPDKKAIGKSSAMTTGGKGSASVTAVTGRSTAGSRAKPSSTATSALSTTARSTRSTTGTTAPRPRMTRGRSNTTVTSKNVSSTAISIENDDIFLNPEISSGESEQTLTTQVQVLARETFLPCANNVIRLSKAINSFHRANRVKHINVKFENQSELMKDMFTGLQEYNNARKAFLTSMKQLNVGSEVEFSRQQRKNEETICKLEEEKRKLINEKIKLDEMKQKLTKEYEILKATHEAVDVTWKQRLEDDTLMYKKESTVKSEENGVLKAKLELLVAENQSLKSQLTMINETNTEKKMMEDKINALENDREGNLTNITLLKDRITGMEKEIEELHQVLGGKNVELEEIENKLKNEEANTKKLREEMESNRSSMDDKSKELTMALTSFMDTQRKNDTRENELKDSLKESQDKVITLENELQLKEKEINNIKFDLTTVTTELDMIKATSMNEKESLSTKEKEINSLREEINTLVSQINVEKTLRTRAEEKEVEEKNERIAANSQLLAMQKSHQEDIESWREKLNSLDQEKADEEKTLLLKQDEIEKELKVNKEKVVSLNEEREVLRNALQDSKKSCEKLSELAAMSGEVVMLKQRIVDNEETKEQAIHHLNEEMKKLQKQITDGESQRRKLHNVIQELRGNVRVFARVRPYIPQDGSKDGLSGEVIDVHNEEESIEIRSPTEMVKKGHRFNFDKCFGQSTGQDVIFDEVSEFVQSALDGFNVCLMSYGQTGSGKTHTMQGSGSGPMRGIIPRAMEQVGLYKEKMESQGWVYQLQVSFIEIYNELFRDLLKDFPSSSSSSSSSSSTVSLNGGPIRIDHTGQIMEGDVMMVEFDPMNIEEINKIMEVASRARSVGCTDMNAESSRSHSVFTLHLKAINKKKGSELSGKLYLADLAGSERISRSGATGERLKETQAINKSLSSMVDVFTAISNGQSHIPFRNSKLTHLLKQCLSGDGKTLMMINLSPTADSYQESLCTLKFASHVNQCELGRAKKNIVTSNKIKEEEISSNNSNTNSSTSAISGINSRSNLLAPTASSSIRKTVK